MGSAYGMHGIVKKGIQGFGRHEHKWKNNIKMNLKETGWEGRD